MHACQPSIPNAAEIEAEVKASLSLSYMVNLRQKGLKVEKAAVNR